jgi:hypothetical protein
LPGGETPQLSDIAPVSRPIANLSKHLWLFW